MHRIGEKMPPPNKLDPHCSKVPSGNGTSKAFKVPGNFHGMFGCEYLSLI